MGDGGVQGAVTRTFLVLDEQREWARESAIRTRSSNIKEGVGDTLVTPAQGQVLGFEQFRGLDISHPDKRSKSERKKRGSGLRGPF